MASGTPRGSWRASSWSRLAVPPAACSLRYFETARSRARRQCDRKRREAGRGRGRGPLYHAAGLAMRHRERVGHYASDRFWPKATRRLTTYSVEKPQIAGAAKFCRISRQSKTLTRLRLIGDQDVLYRDINPFMYPPSLERASRLITPRIFPSSVKKEFFNRIDPKRTLLAGAWR